MSESGYVYVLMNPSLEGLVKIGMTTREPDERLTELSSATGVPTPFLLVYKEYFDDCYQAEKIAHNVLESKRVSSNREFFQVPVYDAIKVIQDISKMGITTNNEDEDLSLKDNSNLTDLAEEIFEKAEEYHYGFGEELEDHYEALKLYKKAASLGSVKANKILGLMYYEGDGCKRDINLAVDFLKKGATLGDRHSYAELGKIFFQRESYNKSNAEKCWASYFDMLNPTMKHQDDNDYIGDYIYMSLQNGVEIKFLDKLQLLKAGLLTAYKYRIERYPHLARQYKAVVDFLGKL